MPTHQIQRFTNIKLWVADLVTRGLINRTDPVEYKGNHAVIKANTRDRVSWMETVASQYRKTDRTNKVVYNPKGSGSTIGRLECGKLAIFLKPLRPSPTHYEDEQVNRINTQIQRYSIVKGDGCILLEHDNQIYQVSMARKVHHKPDPKADIELLGSDRKTPILWISHKAGRSATDFQNWAGLSDRNEETLSKLNPVKNFVKALRATFPNGMSAGDLVAYELGRTQDEVTLKYGGVFRNQWGKDYGINNVNWVLQGSINIVPSTKGIRDGLRVYTLSATGHVMVNRNLPNIRDINSTSSPYAPVIMANYRADRNNFGVKHSRSGLYPISYKNAKSKAYWLNKK